MEGGERVLMAAGLAAAVVVGAFVLWRPGGGVRARRGRVAGLQNLGRTCFLNTLLQALAACPRFAIWLRDRATQGPTHATTMTTTLSTVIEVVNGSHESARGAGPVCPLGVLRCLGALGWVVPEDQHDAHELLHVLFSCIDEENQAASKRHPGCLSDALGLLADESRSIKGEGSRDDVTLAPFPALRSVSSPATPDSPLVKCARSLSQAAITLSDKTKNMANDLNSSRLHPEFGSGISIMRGVSRSFCQLDRLGRPSTPIPPPPQPPFHGTLATRLQCTICSYKTPIRYDKFDSLSLQLGEAPCPLSIVGLLRMFTSPEMVKGVSCTKCNDGRDPSLSPILTSHIKTQNIGKLPVCLCLHIGRTQWGPSGLTKRSDHVFFQETLSLSPYASTQPMKGDTNSVLEAMSHSLPTNVGQYANFVNTGTNGGQSDWRALYRLQAVVVHVGGPKSGHFITYRRGNGFEAKRWFYTSDTVVHEVTLDEVLHSIAYMLFYEKISINEKKPPTRVPQI